MSDDNFKFWENVNAEEFTKGVLRLLQATRNKASHSSGIVDEKDWEIQCIVWNKKNYWLKKDGMYNSYLLAGGVTSDFILSNGGYIFQVLRKSDGLVFSVGDEVNYGKIEKFFIEGGMNVHFTNGNGATLASIKPIPQRRKLFTTEDGVAIFEGDNFWYVTPPLRIFNDMCDSMTGGKYIAHSRVGDKFFSTKEKAEEYITLNKPLNLSMKEIASCITNYVCKGRPFGPATPDKSQAVIDFEKLDNLIKSKL